MKKRLLLYSTLALVALAAAAPYLPAGAFRGPIERSLERSLNRDVEIGDVRFTFFPSLIPSPGFTLEGVTIHEDPRAGIEPFAYMEEAGASVRILPLFARRLELSTLDLGDASINIVKTDTGPWNFQYLLERLNAQEASMPALRMRAGRVNFKFGDTKSIFYFNDADLDVAPASDGSMELRFGGAPSRSNRSAQDFGRFFIRGTSSANHERLNFLVELERSPLEDTLRLIDPHGFGVHGSVALSARLEGPPSSLKLQGSLQVSDIHRWDLLPQEGGGRQLSYEGTLDLAGERLEVASTAQPDAPFTARFRVSRFLNDPQWDAGAELHEVRLTTLLEIGRHMGAILPENLTVDGSVSGSVDYNETDGVSGNLKLTEASLSLPDAEPLRAPEATLAVSGGTVTLEPSMVEIGNQIAEVRGTVTLATPRALDLRISTRGLDVAAMRSFGLAAIPVIEQTPRGSWSGWARYRGTAEAAGGETRGEWTGESRLEDANLRVEGLAEPLEIETANVRLTGRGVSLTRVRGTVAGIPFTGAYGWDPREPRPHTFSVVMDEADASILQGLLAPSLTRDPGGFLARTLRLNAAPPVPAWLRQRRADGIVSVETLTAGDWTVRGLKARLLWDGASARLAAVGGLIGSAAFTGDLTIDLTGVQPRYHYDGEITGVPYQGGRLDFFGVLDADGAGAELLATARAEGSIQGRSIAFAPDAEFRTINACFVLSQAGAPRWKLTTVEVTRDGDTLLGTGASQADGRMLLELSQGEKLYGRLFAAQ